jgi:translation initiation factor 1 (eIF-1/SUI1)
MSDIEEFNDDFNNIIHINIEQLKARKFKTIVSGFPDEFDYPRTLRFWKKTFNYHGRIEWKDTI